MSMKRWTFYFISKFAAAGSIFLAFLIVPTGFDLYAMSDMTRELPLWPIFYGYAVLFAIAADIVRFKLRNRVSGYLATITLYVAGGYVPFVGWTSEINATSIVAGTVGACCSLAFLMLSAFFRKRPLYNMTAALALPLVLLIVSLSDFTIVKGLKDTYTSTGYEAKFTYFRGQIKLPVDLQRDQVLAFRVEWSDKIAGGYGHYVLDPNGRRTGMTNFGASSQVVHAMFDGQYRIVITGDKISGAVRVDWEIIE